MEKVAEFEQGGITFVVYTEVDYDSNGEDYLGTFVDKQPDSYFVDRKRGILFGGSIDEPEEPEELTDDDEAEKKAILKSIRRYCNRRYGSGKCLSKQLELKRPILFRQELYDIAFNEWDEDFGLERLDSALRSRWSRDACRFWKPENHLPHKPENWAHVPEEDLNEVIAKYGSLEKADIAYALEDYKRHESLGDSWCFLGYIVKAFVDGVEVGDASCWGIESDCGMAYTKEIVGDLVGEVIENLSKEGLRLREVVDVIHKAVVDEEVITEKIMEEWQ